MKKIFIVIIFFLSISLSCFSQVCNSIYFDGVDDGVKLMHPMISGQTYSTPISSKYTAEFWLKTSANSGTIFEKGTNGSYGFLRIEIDQNGFLKASHGGVGFAPGSSSLSLYSYNPINDNQWHHIAYLRDTLVPSSVIGGYDYVEKLFVDGVIVDSTTNTSSNHYLIYDNFYAYPFTIGHRLIGVSTFTPQNYFNGYLDNVKFWDRALENNEIVMSMNECNYNANGLLFSFNFDSIINSEFEDSYGIHYGEIIDISLSTDNPVCCDCQISTNDTTVCKSEEVIVTSNSNLDYLWPDGSTTNSFSIYAFNDTTIQLIFTDNGNIICSDSIDINVNIPIIPTITQIGTSLSSSQANYYQWYMDGVILNGENSQILQNVTNGVYSVVTKDINGCMSESALYTIFNTASWDCLNNDCVDLGNGTGIYSTLSECQLNCMTSQIQENTTTKELLKVTDLLGREIDNPKQPSIYFYNDGTVEKKLIVD